MTIHIERIDQRRAPEETLVKLHELWTLWDLEERPDDSPMPLAQRIADFRHQPETRDSPKWLLWDEGDLVGVSGAFMTTDQDLENGFVAVFVHPEQRGLGHARALLEPAIAELERQRRIRVAAEAPFHTSGGGLAEAAGLKPVMVAKRSRLVLADLDMGLMRSWVERAQQRASDYELVFAESPVPDGILDQFVELLHVMNTAPLEDYEEEDRVWTAADWRNREETTALREEKIFNMIARHRPTGEFAGFTNINYQGHFPEQAWQWDTGVDPAHRNKGLGRWLKAAMIQRLLDSFPEVERIDTYNAGSNEPMLNINIEMGFKPIFLEQVYQGPTSAVRTWLDAGPRAG